MRVPYRVAIADEGCGECERGRTFSVIGPDDVAHSEDFGDEEQAEGLRDACNRAYELGQSSKPDNPWTAFEKELPPDGATLLIWDAQFNCINNTYFAPAIHTPEYLAKNQYTHWMLASWIPAPNVPVQQQHAPPLVIEPAPAPVPVDATTDHWTDDIPF